MEGQPVKRVSCGYLACYILIPLAGAALGLYAGRTWLRGSGAGAACMAAAPLLAVLWWAFGGRLVYRAGRRRMAKRLDGMGIDRRQIFYGESCVVSMDMERRKMGLLFFWNPFQVQVIPAGRVARAWADDGARGTGRFRGTSRVSFLFEIDGAEIRVNTFISNQRWKLDDNRVLEGISKADLWVHVLEEARSQEEGVGNGDC